MVRTAIVVEGGAMRGIFSAGVLDALDDAGLTDFDLAIGTSAGACNLASFVAGQRGRNLPGYAEVMCEPELFSPRRALAGGHFMDLDWLWNQFSTRDPLDEAAIARSRTELISVATCARTGRPHYHSLRSDAINALKGGCALPLLYRGPVRLGADEIIDGGISAPIAAAEAYRRGARRILVVRSRPIGSRKTTGPIDLIGALLLARRPALARALATIAQTYNRCAEFVDSPPTDTLLLQIAPVTPLQTGRTTQDSAILHADYTLGYEHTQSQLPAIQQLLNIPADSQTGRKTPGVEQAP